ncbi:unnamed protein product [Adineta steineri]|uniref:Early endosome antigen 1 n=1 Tax=Adineta steineri TaxID=433720 RepID=A0A813ZMM1_9BILA|nr:unnamed protein product [Adineta steineri]CAF3670560.1 unnamed protein product [Adineta steineri]
MSNFLNRLKNIKTGINNFNNNEGDNGSICSFDEEGFLCPICHRKFFDTTGLENHYLQAHSEPQSATTYEQTTDPHQEVAIWKKQFCQSEESRMQITSELMQQRQRVGDLEEEVELLHKQLRTTQLKVIEQSQEIGNLKASKDGYDAQIAMFTNELLNTQGELKEKQNQVNTLCHDLIPRPTTDDVDVLKRELITVQQHMNEMSLEKEQQIERLRNVLLEISTSTKQLDQIENIFDQNVLIYDEILNNHTSQIETDMNQIKQFIQLTRERKEKIVATSKYMRNCLNDNHAEIDQLKQKNAQLHLDLEHRNQLNEQLTNDLQNEQKLMDSNRIQIETLKNEINELENTLDELKQEKNQLFLTKMGGDQDDERQNLVRQLTQEKDQFEQQVKELRKQIKQINEEKENIQKEFTQINNEKNQLQEEQVRFNNEINLLKQQLDDLNTDKEQQIKQINQEYITTNTKLEDDLRQINENNNNQKQEIERLENELKEIKSQLTEQTNQLNKEKSDLQQSLTQQEESSNEIKIQFDTIQKEKDYIEKQLETNQQTIEELQRTMSELRIELNQKTTSINRLNAGIRHSIDLAHKTHQYIQQNIHLNQINLLSIIEQSQEESQAIRTQTLEDIRNEFTNYLTVIHTVIVDNKTKLEKQINEDNMKLIEEQQHAEKQLNKLQKEHDQLIKEYNEQKQKLEIQLGELNNNLLQVSESLSESTQTANLQREKSEKQIASLEHELTSTRSDLESQIKKYEMQTTALRENLATVRGELKTAQEKLVNFEKIKLDKEDLEARLIANQDERHALLERSITSENRSEKLLLENGQLAKKNSDLESALQEIAREYQGLQIYTNKLNQRRWLNDNDVHECMKCNQTFTITQRKHHCRSCGNIFCDPCSSKLAVVAATSKKPQRVCDQCFKELTS